MTEEILNKKLADIPIDDLIEKCQCLISELAKTSGRSFSMSIPPNQNDTDMLLGEAIRRLKEASMKVNNND